MNQSSGTTALSHTILIVEDERAIAENLLLTLESEGMVADIARNVAAARYFLQKEHYDLVVLDIGLPDGDGHQVIKHLREQLQLSTPVLVLTARTALEDKIAGFSFGADDYLTKPFALEELVLRVRALIRRSKQLSESMFVLRHGPLEMSLSHRQVTVHGKEVRLTRKSLLVLEWLMRYGGRVVPREKLEDILWHGEPPSGDALRSQLHLLRKALQAHGYDGIETVHGIGWRLAATTQQPTDSPP
ncbi:chemotaxis protein CheY [Lampropedia cohaerens]|uniref:Chemotaxis protein CheY n=1 Tax=Lampropedia cohaerens TaxID=1610491 RepID=A0A0U1Q0C9_9BURK|nr:response regulator [Lampropedia cohaerens]KKW68219.1 chemotaxis protein CheY [Lampropedia cohaerens]